MRKEEARDDRSGWAWWMVVAKRLPPTTTLGHYYHYFSQQNATPCNCLQKAVRSCKFLTGQDFPVFSASSKPTLPKLDVARSNPVARSGSKRFADSHLSNLPAVGSAALKPNLIRRPSCRLTSGELMRAAQ
jgi:hypothetical protein